MKKKILIWGTRILYTELQREIHIALGDVEILALINNEVNSPKIIDGYPVITKWDISNYEYDEIVIFALEHFGNESSIRKDAAEVGVPAHKLVFCSKYFEQKTVGDTIDMDIENQLGVLKAILAADDEQIRDFDWMYQKFCEYGVYTWMEDSCKFGRLRCTKNGMMQIPDEFIKFCIFLADFKMDSAIEVGVFRGRSSYFMCAVLMRNNPDLRYVMVDIQDNLDHFEKYKEVLPALEKSIPSTSEDYKGKAYDFVFIDADHSYDGSIKDYFNVGQYANKIVAFHDICGHEFDHLNGGTVRMWKEVMEMNSEKECHVFSKYLDRIMGIGCVKM